MRLANAGESAPPAFSAEYAGAAIAWNEGAADLFGAKQELADAITVFNRMATLRQTAGSSPELERALAAQIEAVKLLQPAAVAEPNPAPDQPALQLKLNRVKPVDSASIEKHQRETEQWLTDYRVNLNRLVEVAQAAEGIHA
mgnify:CR=1 FL=1